MNFSGVKCLLTHKDGLNLDKVYKLLAALSKRLNINKHPQKLSSLPPVFTGG